MALRILLADDNPDVLTVLTAVLEREGFEIAATARDGASAAPDTVRPRMYSPVVFTQLSSNIRRAISNR